MSKLKILGTLAVTLIAGSAYAQSAEQPDLATADRANKKLIEEVITIGTRVEDRLALYSPVPVDVLSVEEIIGTGQTEVGRIIQSLAPSFNFSSSSISDGTDALRPATLRGLGPDQLLVLVNGKRRHGSALLHINTSVGRGTSGTDLNAIPQIAIGKVEILRDGASAQYGSDAIAGVINLRLANSPEDNRLSLHYGEYQEGDGENLAVSFVRSQNFGHQDAGFWSIAVEYRDRGSTNRAGLTGSCQYTGSCTSIGNDEQMTSDAREINFARQNFRIGDAESKHLSGVFNLSIPIKDKFEIYLFGTYSSRENESAGFYRRANQANRNPTFRRDGVTEVNNGNAYIEDGFLPLIDTEIIDYSLDFGINGAFNNDWSWDASFGYGLNEYRFGVSNSINASLVADTGESPRSAKAGAVLLGLLTAELSVRGPWSWGHSAFGVAWRRDLFEQKAGEELSYRDYDGPGGSSASGGIQVFPGYQPGNEADEDRDSVAAYADLEVDLTNQLTLGVAARYENYNDFGDTLNAKGTLLLNLSEQFSIRAALSTGFRAPGLAQLYFSSTSTQFVEVGGVFIPREVGVFRNNSTLVKALGIPELTEEKSISYSFGAIFRPTPNLSLTLDYYRIDIDDRVVISGQVKRGLNSVLDAGLIQVNANSAQFFLNAANTETQGFDLIGEYNIALPNSNQVVLSLGINRTKTEITSLTPPGNLASDQSLRPLLFTAQDQSIIEEWQPTYRINASATYSTPKFNAVVSLRHYGDYTVTEGASASQKFEPKSTIDLRFSYQLIKSLGLTVGGNNVTDQTPSRNRIGQSRSGRILDNNNNVVVDSPGVFTYSRRAAPFGFNGAYWYVGLTWNM